MSILLDDTYHGLKHLKDSGVQVLFEESDHVVNLGIINLMPQAEVYEVELLKAFSGVTDMVRPIWLRLENHGYRSSNKEVIQNYALYGQSPYPLHGLMVTGAPVEHLPFEEVHYWRELEGILRHAQENLRGAMGICWGGLAMARIAGLEKRVFSQKQFGVYPTQNLKGDHPAMGAYQSTFFCPVSTHAGVGDACWEAAEREGRVRLLAHAEGIGYLIAESMDGRFLMHFGHPEYGARRLPEEYKRDKERGGRDARPPVNVDLLEPDNLWKKESDCFFQRWIANLRESHD